MSIVISRVYTRSGDNSQTSLSDGTRVSKADSRVCAYGDVDELNSALGLVSERFPAVLSELKASITEIQQELFDLGAELSTPPASRTESSLKISSEQVERLERLCDEFNKDLPELNSFVLPGGSEAAASFHWLRTVARRAERSIVAAASVDPDHATPDLLKYINRLSDLFFVWSRWVLAKEIGLEFLWIPGNQRQASKSS